MPVHHMVPLPAPARRDSNTMHAIGSHLQYRMLQMAHYGQPTIDIELDESQHEANRAIFSYSTMDTMYVHQSGCPPTIYTDPRAAKEKCTLQHSMTPTLGKSRSHSLARHTYS
ncbi:hypothetical protein DPSP01_009368 [Paraphaeosphaeria sporulosa]